MMQRVRWIKGLVPQKLREWYWRQLLEREVARRLYKLDQSVFGQHVASKLSPGVLGWKTIHSVLLPGSQYPLYFRRSTSDAAVIRQVFGRREYAAVEGLADVGLILDCGANIGCTSFFLLHKYPDAQLIAVEPDAANMALCKKNLAPFKERVTFVQAGVWDSNSELRVVRGAFRDGEPWSFQVRPCEKSDVPDFRGVTIGDLLLGSGRKSIDLLKMDIEGAERVVLSAAELGWLRQTRTIAIELHDEECSQAFHDAIAGYEHELRTSGELVICDIRQPNGFQCDSL